MSEYAHHRAMASPVHCTAPASRSVATMLRSVALRMNVAAIPAIMREIRRGPNQVRRLGATAGSSCPSGRVGGFSTYISVAVTARPPASTYRP